MTGALSCAHSGHRAWVLVESLELWAVKLAAARFGRDLLALAVERAASIVTVTVKAGATAEASEGSTMGLPGAAGPKEAQRAATVKHLESNSGQSIFTDSLFPSEPECNCS